MLSPLYRHPALDGRHKLCLDTVLKLKEIVQQVEKALCRKSVACQFVQQE